MKISTKFVTGSIDNLFHPELGFYLPSFEEEKELIVSFQELALRRKDKKYSFSCLQTQLFEAMFKEQKFLKTLKENPVNGLQKIDKPCFLNKPLYLYTLCVKLQMEWVSDLWIIILP